jgi:nickel-dependent lactate racemase
MSRAPTSSKKISTPLNNRFSRTTPGPATVPGRCSYGHGDPNMFQWTRSCSYDEEQKRRFHSIARSRHKKLAAELALSVGTYHIRSNKAGIAVSGEITPHHEQV